MSKNNNKKPAATNKKVITDRHLRLPKDLDDWLVEYTSLKGFNSEMEALRQIIRERREEAATA